MASLNKKRRWTPEEKQEVISYFKNTNYTTKEIADLFDVTPVQIRTLLYHSGLSVYSLRPLSKKPPKLNPKKEEKAELELKVLTALRTSNSKMREVAKMFDLSIQQVTRILMKHNMNLTCLRKGYYDKE